jgi:hypothetical protein
MHPKAFSEIFIRRVHCSLGSSTDSALHEMRLAFARKDARPGIISKIINFADGRRQQMTFVEKLKEF